MEMQDYRIVYLLAVLLLFELKKVTGLDPDLAICVFLLPFRARMIMKNTSCRQTF